MTDEMVTGSPIELTVAGHHFHRNETGTVTHHINGRPDHSTGGLLSTVEVFAAEITRLRQLVPSGEANEEEAPPLVHPLRSRPDQ